MQHGRLWNTAGDPLRWAGASYVIFQSSASLLPEASGHRLNALEKPDGEVLLFVMVSVRQGSPPNRRAESLLHEVGKTQPQPRPRVPRRIRLIQQGLQASLSGLGTLLAAGV